MFFGNTKLEKEIEQKQQLIERLKHDIKSLKSQHKDALRSLKKELEKVSKAFAVLDNEHKEYVHKVESSTNIDLVSGANNKRYFYDIVESMISLAKRHKTDLSVGLIRIDNLRNLNAKKVCQKIQKNIADKPLLDEIYLNLSIGVAEFSENENINSVLKRAEEFLEAS